jgi:putative NADH-flavin reductase
MQICNLLDPHDLTKKIVGSDVIISVLGSSAVSFYQESIKSIVDAMRNAKLTRLICVTSHFTKRTFK